MKLVDIKNHFKDFLKNFKSKEEIDLLVEFLELVVEEYYSNNHHFFGNKKYSY